MSQSTEILDVQKMNVKFNIVKLRAELKALRLICDFNDANQLSLTHSGNYSNPNDQMYDGIGSLYDRATDTVIGTEGAYTQICDHIAGTYWEEVIKQVTALSPDPIGRVRLMLLKPKTCYSWHQDTDDIRYHIPIITNSKCFIATEQGLWRMGEEGQLYTLISTVPHTALNASFYPRVHLVFSTYKL